MVTVRFLEVRYNITPRGKDQFAVYECTVVEGEERWQSIVRWSDLARMWDQLLLLHRKELRSARKAIPAFYKHTLRMGSYRVSSELCRQRATTMQGLLNGLIESMHISIVHNRGPRPLIVFLSNGFDVERETPETNWYTVHGWPDSVNSRAARKLAPRSLTPPAGKAPHLYPPLTSRH